jgi:hypothetical protein
MSFSTQSFKLLNRPAGNYDLNPFPNTTSGFQGSSGGVLGGNYVLVFAATGTGTAQLFIRAADNVTLVPVSTSITTTASAQVVTLCPGDYVLEITGFTANNVSITRVPD